MEEETEKSSDDGGNGVGTEGQDLECSKNNPSAELFKKPLIHIGNRNKKGIQTRKVDPTQKKNDSSGSEPSPTTTCESDVAEDQQKPTTIEEVKKTTPPTQTKTKDASVAKNDISKQDVYKQPEWSGTAPDSYYFEVLKEGVNLEPIKLSGDSYFIFGRHTSCDTQLIHPTISRFHLVMQYCPEETKNRSKGFYVYDLGSTHGTFLNKCRIKPQMFVRMQVGHQLRLGCSTRIFILSGPEDDMEPESELTVTQLKAEREKKLLEREMAERDKVLQEEEKKRRLEEDGIDWGMGEDADEETDLTENPYAATNNEELYVSDPKKSLRGWFEREGYDLEYNIEEKGPGQFLCRVEIPMEVSGGKMVAEALVKGKKKEAVVQCALEACRILDRHGLLRQANHESRKRKAKNWEADDYYDSDEDTFLDRTGLVEQKRNQRMAAAGRLEQKAETYESLMKKHEEILEQIRDAERKLHNATEGLSRMDTVAEEEDEDALDSFMKTLNKSGAADKSALNKLKVELANLTKEESKVRRLVNIAKPANLPPVQSPSSNVKSAPQSAAKSAPMIGSLKRVNPQKRKIVSPVVSEQKKSSDFDTNMEEMEEDEDKDSDDKPTEEEPTVTKAESRQQMSETAISQSTGEDKNEIKKDAEVKSKGLIGPARPDFILPSKDDEKLSIPTGEESSDATSKHDEEEDDAESHRDSKKRRRNRIRHHKKDKTFPGSGEGESLDPKYSTWVPPEGQTGDGRTALNDKLGY